MLDHAIAALRRAQGCAELIPVLHPEEYDTGTERDRLKRVFGLETFARGAATRQQSAWAGLLLVRQDVELVLIHDACRPLVSPDTVRRVAEAAHRCGAAIAAVPAVHTVKEVDDEARIVSTPPRHTLWFAHTPQGFRRELILRAHEAARRDGFEGTDDAQLVERIGGEVRVVRDSDHNLKVTTPEDVVMAEAVLAWRAERPDVEA